MSRDSFAWVLLGAAVLAGCGQRESLLGVSPPTGATGPAGGGGATTGGQPIGGVAVVGGADAAELDSTGATGSGTPTSGGSGGITATGGEESGGITATGGELPSGATGGRGADTGGSSPHAEGGNADGGNVGGGNAGGGNATTGGSGGIGNGGGTGNGGGAATGGNGGVGTGGGNPLVAPTISQLSVEPNPNSTISAYVGWTTDLAASSEVQFGTTSYEFRIRDETAVTDHRVLVIGMYADTTYMIRAVSANGGGSDSTQASFTTGSLPATVPLPELTVSAPGSQSGWTLASIQPDPDVTSELPPGVMVMYDELGKVVWYFINGDQPDERGDVSVDYLPNGNVLVGPTTLDAPKEVDLAGNVIWQGPPQPSEPYGSIMSHDVRKLRTGNYVLLRNHYNAEGFLGALIEEVTPANELVWEWNLFDHIQPDPIVDDLDFCHPNSVSVDEENDIVYLACRWIGVIKVDRSSKAVIWTLGEGGDRGNFAFDPPESAFADEHDPEFHDDGTVLIYDNGGYTYFPTGNEHSRVLEFTLDETGMVAHLVWSFPADFDVDPWYHDNWYTPFWGDADQAANGNVIITAGMRSSSASTRIFEVQRADGQIVWEIVFDPNVGCYQSERISPPPLVERLSDG